ncbi:MAG: tetratricopeptide repeat protein [Casimicrobiaceae bacterium]
MSDGYSVRDVTRLLGLSRSIVTGFIRAGIVAPARGRRGEYRFSFPDLVVLRSAQALTDAHVPPARIVRSLRRLRARLPDAVPLNGLRVEAVGDTVVVTEGSAQWQPDDGQYVLRFGVTPASSGISFFDASPPRRAEPATDWFARALELERADTRAACEAYRNALRDDPRHLDAYINLGVCLANDGQAAAAEQVYRDGLAHCGIDGALLFNLAVLLEDGGRYDDAVATYRAAVVQAPELADAHYNLALLCEQRGLRQEALRHLQAYRKLQHRSN